MKAEKNSFPSQDAVMQITNDMIDLDQYLREIGVKTGSAGYYLRCYCGDGAPAKAIAEGPNQAVLVEVKKVGKVEGQNMLGVFLTDPPRQLKLLEVTQHVLWGKLDELKAEFAYALK